MAVGGDLRQRAQRCGVFALLLLALALGLASVGCVTAFPEGQHWPEHARPSGGAPLSDADLHLALLKGAQSRWSDPALVSSATAMRRWVGMALYEQVCWTISRYHVDVFSYSDLLRLGLGNLRAALDAEEFLKMSPRAADAAAAEEFKAAIRRIERAVARAPPKSLRTLRRWVLLVLAENDRTVELPAGAVLAELVFGSANRLDGFSLYFTHEMLAVFKEALRGRYVGVGIEVAREDDHILIKGVVKGSPAEKAGLQVGDIIVAVDGKNVADEFFGETVRRMRGAPGTEVRLTLRRPGKDRSWEVVLRRTRIGVSSVRDAHLIEGTRRIGYVKVSAFGMSTSRALARAIRQLKEQGCNALIIDLRGNPGGLLSSAVSVCEQFLPSGKVVLTRGRGLWKRRDYAVSRVSTTTWDGPLALIIDRSSASAAEVVAAALKSHGRATLVGQPTYGKDALQIVLPMEWGRSALDLTISRMSDPEGNSWGGAGVAPHHLVDVKNKSAEGDAKLDAMLAKAIEVLHRKIHKHSAQRAE